MIFCPIQRKRQYLLPFLVSNGISLIFWTAVMIPILLPIIVLMIPLGKKTILS